MGGLGGSFHTHVWRLVFRHLERCWLWCEVRGVFLWHAILLRWIWSGCHERLELLLLQVYLVGEKGCLFTQRVDTILCNGLFFRFFIKKYALFELFFTKPD